MHQRSGSVLRTPASTWMPKPPASALSHKGTIWCGSASVGRWDPVRAGKAIVQAVREDGVRKLWRQLAREGVSVIVRPQPCGAAGRRPRQQVIEAALRMAGDDAHVLPSPASATVARLARSKIPIRSLDPDCRAAARSGPSRSIRPAAGSTGSLRAPNLAGRSARAGPGRARNPGPPSETWSARSFGCPCGRSS